MLEIDQLYFQPGEEEKPTRPHLAPSSPGSPATQSINQSTNKNVA